MSRNGWGGVDVRTDANGRDAGELQRSDADSFLALPPGARNDLRPGRRYIVTGCAGFIGSHLIEALSSQGCSVLGVDAFTDNYPRAIKERNLNRASGWATCASRSSIWRGALEPLLDGVDGVFHLAGRPGVRTSWGSIFDTYLHDNVQATQRIFEAAVHHEHQGRLRFLVVRLRRRRDLSPARGRQALPVSPYGVSKLACEALASTYTRSLGLDAVGLRYFSVYGPRQRPGHGVRRGLRLLGAQASVPPVRQRSPEPRLHVRRGRGRGDARRDAMRDVQRPVYNVGGGSRDLDAGRADPV